MTTARTNLTQPPPLQGWPAMPTVWVRWLTSLHTNVMSIAESDDDAGQAIAAFLPQTPQPAQEDQEPALAQVQHLQEEDALPVAVLALQDQDPSVTLAPVTSRDLMDLQAFMAVLDGPRKAPDADRLGGQLPAAYLYILPAATASVLGGVKPDGTTLKNTSGAISFQGLPSYTVAGLPAGAAGYRAWASDARGIVGQPARLDGSATSWQLAPYGPAPASALTLWDWMGQHSLMTTARTNLIHDSEDFSATGWSYARVTKTTGQPGPDGATTATFVNETTDNGHHFVVQNVTYAAGTVVVFAVAKANGRNRLNIREATTSGAEATFDLSSGTVVAQANGATGRILALPMAGWYLCSMSFTVASGSKQTTFALLPDTASYYNDAAGSYAGTVGVGILLRCVQAEVGSASGDYLPAGASPGAVADYTVSDSGLVTLARTHNSGDLLFWSATGCEAVHDGAAWRRAHDLSLITT